MAEWIDVKEIKGFEEEFYSWVNDLIDAAVHDDSESCVDYKPIVEEAFHAFVAVKKKALQKAKQAYGFICIIDNDLPNWENQIASLSIDYNEALNEALLYNYDYIIAVNKTGYEKCEEEMKHFSPIGEATFWRDEWEG